MQQALRTYMFLRFEEIIGPCKSGRPHHVFLSSATESFEQRTLKHTLIFLVLAEYVK
ncbi:hypothetical protein HAX54_012434, partial [Datura stramonium]|nr:hypothetical protein [Datura stramonium]